MANFMEICPCFSPPNKTIWEKLTPARPISVFKIMAAPNLYHNVLMLHSDGNSRVVRTTCEYSGKF